MEDLEMTKARLAGKSLNPHVAHTIDVRDLPRQQQPWPATPRTKMSMLIPHMVKHGYFKSNP